MGTFLWFAQKFLFRDDHRKRKTISNTSPVILKGTAGWTVSYRGKDSETRRRVADLAGWHLLLYPGSAHLTPPNTGTTGILFYFLFSCWLSFPECLCPVGRDLVCFAPGGMSDEWPWKPAH